MRIVWKEETFFGGRQNRVRKSVVRVLRFAPLFPKREYECSDTRQADTGTLHLGRPRLRDAVLRLSPGASLLRRPVRGMSHGAEAPQGDHRPPLSNTALNASAVGAVRVYGTPPRFPLSPGLPEAPHGYLRKTQSP
nr:MAG TPA: hypothetical protein [Caudoviricetes sp.]